MNPKSILGKIPSTDKDLNLTTSFHEFVIEILKEIHFDEKTQEPKTKKKKLNVKPGKNIGQEVDSESDDEPGTSNKVANVPRKWLK